LVAGVELRDPARSEQPCCSRRASTTSVHSHRRSSLC
jgi:hypothetical protein